MLLSQMYSDSRVRGPDRAYSPRLWQHAHIALRRDEPEGVPEGLVNVKNSLIRSHVAAKIGCMVSSVKVDTVGFSWWFWSGMKGMEFGAASPGDVNCDIVRDVWI